MGVSSRPLGVYKSSFSPCSGKREGVGSCTLPKSQESASRACEC